MDSFYSKVYQKFREDLLFYIISILFAVIFCFMRFGGDDPVAYNTYKDKTVLELWNLSVDGYQTWTSRTVVNFIITAFLNIPVGAFAVFLGISMFILLKAFMLLFAGQKQEESRFFIVCLVMMFPFWHYNTAGWLVTLGTYFCPVAFGFMSLVPIKKMFNKVNIKWWEYILYTLFLIYGSNIEQMMVVILCSYLIAFIWFVANKKYNIYCGILLLLSIASCFYTLLCPGNSARKQEEIATWFPEYGMLNIVDKLDLGVFTTLRWMFFDNNIIIIFSCVLLAVFIWKKYESYFIRWISLYPVIITLLLGPFRSFVSLVFPAVGSVATISEMGLVTAENRGGIGAFLQYVVMTFALVAIIIEIFMLSYDLPQFLSSMVLLGAGFASRVALGFSPTVYASNLRTFDVLLICIIATLIYIYGKCIDNNVLNGKRGGILHYTMGSCLILSFINLVFLVELSFK